MGLFSIWTRALDAMAQDAADRLAAANERVAASQRALDLHVMRKLGEALIEAEGVSADEALAWIEGAMQPGESALLHSNEGRAAILSDAMENFYRARGA